MATSIKSRTLSSLIKLTMAGVALTSLQACGTPTAQHAASAPSLVAAAYETSGAVNVPPYTRSIFNSNNF